MYSCSIELDDYGTRMRMEIQKDAKKLYIVVADPITGARREMFLYMKQAQQVLMYCRNDFRRVVGEVLCVHHNKVTLRDINRVIQNLTDQNVREQLGAVM